MKDEEIEKLRFRYLIGCLIAGTILAAVFYALEVRKKQQISEKWQRWNESYSPEADEPEPPKYVDDHEEK